VTDYLVTDTGDYITTDSGNAITITGQKYNDDVQLFDFSVNLMRSIVWQYENATNLKSLIQQKNDWYDVNQNQFWNNWYRDVFNLQTANEFGLQVWSIILDFPLFISKPNVGIFNAWGFGENRFNFGNGNFYNANGNTVVLPLETNRLALKLRYFQLVTSGCVPEINRFLKYVFADYGLVYLDDNGGMTQTYKFTFPITWDLKFLFDNFDLLPRPAGVKSDYQDTTLNYWGFGQNRLNFDNGNFGA
jgi:hypothetical protein